MTNRKKIIIAIAFLALLVAGVFGWMIFSKKKSLKIINETPSVTSEQQPITSNDESVTGEQQPEVISQKSSVNEQQPENSNSQSVISNQKPVEKKVATPVAAEETKDNGGNIVDKFVSWGFQKATDRTIKAVIIHTSYNNLGGDVFDFDKVIQEWKDFGVSPHYAIDRSGTIYHLVADKNIAWHAGVSKLPDGTTDVNGASIGIEIINSQDAKFTDAQYGALNQLIASLKKQYSIKYILGHDDIAPERKTDPWNIDWSKVKK